MSGSRGDQRRLAAERRRVERAATEDQDAVMAAAAAFLAVRPRSVAETRRRLRHHGYPETLVEAVVERLVALRYLDDEAFARAWLESRDRARPRGAHALVRELSQRGVARDVVERALAERDRAALEVSGGGLDRVDGPAGPGEGPSADRSAAERLLRRRAASLAREPDPRLRRQRAYALLARNGFAPDVCTEVAAMVEAGGDTDGEAPAEGG